MASAVVSMSSFIEFRDTRTGKTNAPNIPYFNWPLQVQFSPDGRLLLSAGGTMVANVWDWRTGQLVCPALPHDDQILAGTFIPGKPWVATAGHDGMIKFWDYRTGMAVGPSLKRKGWVLQLQATPDGKTLVVAGTFGMELLDMNALFPKVILSSADTRLLAEIEAAAELHPSGDLVPISSEAWLERWEKFRKTHPDFPDHRMDR
jgi:WD40 repeat protein